jgi:hypothetical protein
MSDIIIPDKSDITKTTRSYVSISRDAGRIVKQSSIPDMIFWINVKVLELFRNLEDCFSLYDKTLGIIQYLCQTLLFATTVGITIAIEFLSAYHAVVIFTKI